MAPKRAAHSRATSDKRYREKHRVLCRRARRVIETFEVKDLVLRAYLRQMLQSGDPVVVSTAGDIQRLLDADVADEELSRALDQKWRDSDVVLLSVAAKVMTGRPTRRVRAEVTRISTLQLRSAERQVERAFPGGAQASRAASGDQGK